jgi:hypothetical protein
MLKAAWAKVAAPFSQAFVYSPLTTMSGSNDARDGSLGDSQDHKVPDFETIESNIADSLVALDSIEETPNGRFIWLICAAASIGGLLFGYDTGVISGVLVVLGNDLGHELSASEKELITSLTSGGACMFDSQHDARFHC